MAKKRKRKNKRNNGTQISQPSPEEAVQVNQNNQSLNDKVSAIFSPIENFLETVQIPEYPNNITQDLEFKEVPKFQWSPEIQESIKKRHEAYEQEIILEKQKKEIEEIEENMEENYDLFGVYDQQNTLPTTKAKSVNMQEGKTIAEKEEERKAPYKKYRQKIEEKPRAAFKKARSIYKSNLEKSKLYEENTKEAKQFFLDSIENDEEKNLISESKYKEYEKARQEALDEYRQQVIDARRTGDLESVKVSSKEEFSSKIRKNIAEKMYGKKTSEITKSEARAFDYFSDRHKSESFNKAIKTRQEALRNLIDEHINIEMINPDDLHNVMTGKKTIREKNTMAASSAAKGEKFNFGKGKVAMAVMGLAGLAGVTSLMFSGGRQQNSNLYNANQAMY